MTDRTFGDVVAALDTSAHDVAVLAWAAAEAERVGAALRLVSVVDAGIQLTPYEALAAGSPSLAEQVDADTRAALEEAAARVRGDHPGLTVDTDIPWGSPATGIVRASESARLLVVGAPAHGMFGSVVVPVMAHAHCPVLVVPEGTDARTPQRAVVGVDGSEPSLRALDFALGSVEPNGGSVTCVAAWRTEVEGGMLVTWPVADPSPAVDERFAQVVETALARVAPRHPGVKTSSVVRHGFAATVLLDVAREEDADLVVIGSRGHGGFTGLLLGSVSRRVVGKAGRPVAVVH
jgi:nucleotide-binding universal stress UspA family protein